MKYLHTPTILILLLTTLALVGSLGGCTGTRSAYKAAEGDPEKIAYVITEHYTALVTEAGRLKDAGTLNGSALASVQAADRIATPLILQLGALSQAYASTRSAADEVALREAIGKSAAAISSFITALKGVR